MVLIIAVVVPVLHIDAIGVAGDVDVAILGLLLVNIVIVVHVGVVAEAEGYMFS